MELATVQTQLPALLTSLLGIPCQWRTQPKQMIVGTQATLDWLGGTGLGADERSLTDVDAAGAPTEVDADIAAVEETVYGLREATVQVTALSLDQTLDKSARAYLETLRTRLRWTSTVEAMKAMGLALVGIQPIVQLDPTKDGRINSQASLDIRLAYGVAETDAPGPFIETARATSAIDDASSTPLTASLQVDVDGS